MSTTQGSLLSVDEKVVVALRRISQAIHVWSRELLQDYGLTSPQLATLRAILSTGESTTCALAASLHLSQPTVTGILTRLELRGLISRQRSTADRRCVRLSVTESGRDLAARSPQLLRDRFRQELATLGEARQSEILRALQQVAAMLDAPNADEAPYFYVE